MCISRSAERTPSITRPDRWPACWPPEPSQLPFLARPRTPRLPPAALFQRIFFRHWPEVAPLSRALSARRPWSTALILVHHDMEPIQDVQRLSGLLGDDPQMRFPHVAAHKAQPCTTRRPQRGQPAAQTGLRAFLADPQQVAGNARRSGRITVRKFAPHWPLPQWISSTPIAVTPASVRWDRPHSTHHSTDRYTVSQLVPKTRAVSRQDKRRAHRAKNPIMALVMGRFALLQGMCSTTTPCTRHSPGAAGRHIRLRYPTAARASSGVRPAYHNRGKALGSGSPWPALRVRLDLHLDRQHAAGRPRAPGGKRNHGSVAPGSKAFSLSVAWLVFLVAHPIRWSNRFTSASHALFVFLHSGSRFGAGGEDQSVIGRSRRSSLPTANESCFSSLLPKETPILSI